MPPTPTLMFACDAPELEHLGVEDVPGDGLDLRVERLPAQERHERMARSQPWDAAEFSLVTYLQAARRGLPLSALAVFPHRTFRHRDIWVAADAGIERPSDLNGRRIGIQGWVNSAIVWQRDLLTREHGFDMASAVWVRNRPDAAGFTPPAWARVEDRPPDRAFEEMLVDGSLDALMLPFPVRFGPAAEGRVRRLFGDFATEEQAYARRSGIFPIMHVLVARSDVLARDPALASALAAAVQGALDRFQARHEATNAPSPLWSGLTWTEQSAVLGPRPWASGAEANRRTLEALVRAAVEQGIVPEPPPLESLFLDPLG